MIFSATIPGFIQELASQRLKDPVLIDLVGDDTNQVPERIENKAVLVRDEQQMFRHIQTYIENNRDKKIIIFTETK
jgi:superfamily II DNA/RNA helicase